MNSGWKLFVILATIPTVWSLNATETAERITVVHWQIHKYSAHIIIMLFMLSVILLKTLFHHIPYLRHYIPESLMLIIVGILFGTMIRYAINVGSHKSTFWTLSPDLFFDYLLPPIILEASYSLHKRKFGENLAPVLIFAILGALLNFLIIGFGMFGLYKAGAFGQSDKVSFSLDAFLLFSSLIIAIDPVAVLAIFQDMGVNLSLYYIVSGESLLNDSITIVLYDVVSAFAGRTIVTGREIGTAIGSFLTDTFGALTIGTIVGTLSCLLTRIQTPFNFFTLMMSAYFSYIFAHTLGWSGLISMIGCGLIQSSYAFHNLNRSSVILVHKVTKVIAELSESIIFLFIGIEILQEDLEWHPGFLLWGLLLCLVSRGLVILTISAVVNRFKLCSSHISFASQILLVYGGLRGAVAFCLADLIQAKSLGVNGVYLRHVIITATLFIILFTVGIMGLTMKPVARLLKIRVEGEKKLSLFQVLMGNVTDELLAGVEVITHIHGMNVVRELFMQFEDRFLRRFLQREPYTHDQKILQVYEQIALQLHYATMQPEKMNELLAALPPTLKKQFALKEKSNISRGLTEIEGENDDMDVVAPLRSRRESQAVGDALRRINLAAQEGKPASRSDLVELEQCFSSKRRASSKPVESLEESLRNIIAARNHATKQNLKHIEASSLLESEPEPEKPENATHSNDRDAEQTQKQGMENCDILRQVSICADMVEDELSAYAQGKNL